MHHLGQNQHWLIGGDGIQLRQSWRGKVFDRDRIPAIGQHPWGQAVLIRRFLKGLHDLRPAVVFEGTDIGGSAQQSGGYWVGMGFNQTGYQRAFEADEFGFVLIFQLAHIT